MKKSPLTLLTGAILLVIFLFLLFAFQVRSTEVAVVTTFGRYSRSVTNAGFNLRLPPPIQKVYKFDSRLQNFERKFEQTLTRDGKNILATVFIGWRVKDPQTFLIRCNGDPLRAEQSLENIVRNAKNGVIGQHNFGELVSPNPQEVKFDEVEKQMLAVIQQAAGETYGISVELLGIKQLGLPENITASVFKRMKDERERLVKKYQGEGEGEARRIESEANVKAKEMAAKADGEALRIRGQAEAEAAKAYAVFEQNPELAIFLFRLNALATSLQNRTTIILDNNTPPMDLLRESQAQPKAAGH
jgi:membrane protease subunit HflC